jgi:hypothetical protein
MMTAFFFRKEAPVSQVETFFCTMTTETRTYIDSTGTHALDGYAGLRIGQRYTGVPQLSICYSTCLPASC